MANEAETGFAAAMLRHQERLAKYLGVPPELQPYLTGNWVVSTDDQQPMTPERAAGYAALRERVHVRNFPEPPPGFYLEPEDDQAHIEALSDFEATWNRIAIKSGCPDMVIDKPHPSRYPHVCPRCSGPAYVGAVAVDCAGGCK